MNDQPIPGLFAAGLAIAAASAQPYPSKSVRVIVPFPAGSGVDAIGRALALRLTDDTGQQFVIDNKPGASGTVAGDYVAKIAPDGHTLFFAASPTLTINPHVQKKMPFNVLTTRSRRRSPSACTCLPRPCRGSASATRA